MIVDLVRNDLGRVCATGTVTVPACAPSRSTRAWSTSSPPCAASCATAPAGRSCSAPTFPPGSVTGAPKSSALRIIDALETAPRGPYCGGIGWVDADRGTGELAVGIRTFWIDRADPGGPVLRFGTGAGITWGSDPEREWAETELKASRLLAVASGAYEASGRDSSMKIWLDGGLQDAEDARVSVFDHGLTVGDGVFETLKAVDGRAFALTRHLDRLTRSARGLGLPDPDHDEVRRACAAVLEANPMPLGRLRITYTGGLVPARLRPGRRRPHPGRRPRRDHAPPRHHRRDHGPLDPQRARRAHRPEDHLVRRERRRPRPRP